MATEKVDIFGNDGCDCCHCCDYVYKIDKATLLQLNALCQGELRNQAKRECCCHKVDIGALKSELEELRRYKRDMVMSQMISNLHAILYGQNPK